MVRAGAQNETWDAKRRRLNFLCPECDKECDHVIGELVFPEFKEAHKYAFRVCWKCEQVRPCKPFGWKPKIKGQGYPVRWRTFKEAAKAMWAVRSNSDEPIDLSPAGLEKLRRDNHEKFRRQEMERGGSRQPRWQHRSGRRG